MTQFKSLRQLRLTRHTGVLRHSFDHWPILDTLVLEGCRVEGNLDVSHKMVRKVRIHHSTHFPSSALNCPSLEELELTRTDMVENCLEHLNFMCPKIKLLKVDTAVFQGKSLDVFHGTLEELTVSNNYTFGVRLTLPKLKVLCLSHGDVALLILRAHCPNLSELCLQTCENLVELPALLNLFP